MRRRSVQALHGFRAGVSLSGTEKAAIKRALAMTQNNVKQAAALLEVNRTTLYRKMKRHGLAPDR